MKRFSHVLLGLLLLASMLSCRKNESTEKEGDSNGKPPIGVNLKDAQVVVPTGVSYDLSGHELLTLGVIQSVDNAGRSKTIEAPKTTNIAVLLNRDKKPVMAGFITDSTHIVSVESTAKVLLYYALGTAFQVDTATHVFINHIDEVPAARDWTVRFADLWKSNPHVLGSGTFVEPLREAVDNLSERPDPIDIRATLQMSTRTSDITVDDGDHKSGLQVYQSEMSKISINNRYRRRAHAFLYKMKYKTEGNTQYTPILNGITQNTVSDTDLPIYATAGATSVVGTTMNLVRGKGMDFAVTSNGPIDLELRENEEEAVYTLRAVGPGKPTGNHPMTSAEASKYRRLLLETLTFDFLMPALSIKIGAMDVDNMQAAVTAVEHLVSTTPGIYDALQQGDFKEALFAALETLASSHGVDALYKILDAVLPASIDSFEDIAESVAGWLGVQDKVLQAIDFGLITGEIAASSALDSWEVVARASVVSLSPKEAAIISFSQQELVAEIKNLDESQASALRFQWSTTGEYGYLIDTENNRGSSFENGSNKIFYNCNAPSGSLSDDDNWEYVYVKAYLDGVVVGSDSTRINVKKHSYEIKPNGITVTGKDKGPSTVRLYLEPINSRVTAIASNPDREYKVVWTTSGKHGGLAASQNGQTMSTVTTYDTNDIWYECTDDKTEEAMETVRARIYSRDKNDPESTFGLFEDVEGEVKINNEAKKKILHVPLTFVSGYSNNYTWNEPRLRCTVQEVFEIPKDPDAESYSMTFYDISISHLAGFPSYPKRATWRADGPFTPFPDLSEQFPDWWVVYDMGASFYYAYSGRGADTPAGDPRGTCAQYASQGQQVTGMAEVIITLK